MTDIKGSGVALITPFTKEDNVNTKKIEELVDFHIANNTDFIVPCGTTGESSTLSFDEKKTVIQTVIKKVNGKIPVIAGTGSNNTKDAIKLSVYAKEQGADGVLVVTPYYNKGNEEGIYMHYLSIANAIFPLPLILYNVPNRTGVDLSVDTIVRLSKVENIIGIKEANPSLEKIENIINNTTDFKVFSGNDNLSLPIILSGGAGTISVCANIIPEAMHKICTTCDKTLFYEYLNLMNILFLDVNPIMIKEAMNYLNFDVGNVRLPLYLTSEKNREKLIKELKKMRV